MELPVHMMSATSLAPKKGKRVEVRAVHDISLDECLGLIEYYIGLAAPDGQISVHKPCGKLGGSSAPWAVENFDGKGVQFNNTFFE